MRRALSIADSASPEYISSTTAYAAGGGESFAARASAARNSVAHNTRTAVIVEKARTEIISGTRRLDYGESSFAPYEFKLFEERCKPEWFLQKSRVWG